MSEESTLSFRGLCRYIHRLSKASKAGMKAALADCPKCHFPMLEGLLGCIRLHGQDGAVYISDLVQELHQPLPAISRTVRQVRFTPKGYEACRQCEAALGDYFSSVMARLEPEQLAQMEALRGALMEAILAENAARTTKPKGEPNHDKDL